MVMFDNIIEVPRAKDMLRISDPDFAKHAKVDVATYPVTLHR